MLREREIEQNNDEWEGGKKGKEEMKIEDSRYSVQMRFRKRSGGARETRWCGISE